MPTAPPHACANRACPNLAAKGHRYCPVCEAAGMGREEARAYDARRGSARERGYDGAWERVRARVLKANGICLWPGCFEPADTVHHIWPLNRGGGHEDWNLVSLDGQHHWEYENRWGRHEEYRLVEVQGGWRATRNGESLCNVQARDDAGREMRRVWLEELGRRAK